MIKLPEEIKKILRTIEDKGYQAYVVGGSIRDLLLGIEPLDWDLASNAPPKMVSELFPQSDLTGEKFGVVRVRVGDVEADVAALRIDGNYSDHRRPDEVIFTDSIEEDLLRRDFTINGMAYNLEKGLIDPFNGKKDLEEKLIRVIGDPDKRLNEDPLRILRGIRIAGQLDCDIHMDTFKAMQDNAQELEHISMDRRRQEFERLMVTKNTGKALRMCVAANVMPAILGDSYPPKGREVQGDFKQLIQTIDKSRQQLDLRMTLLILCFDKKSAYKIIEHMNYSGKMAKKFKSAIELLEDLYFSSGDRYLLKRFIYKNGMETYEFLDSVTKQQRNVYDIPGYRIESRYYLLDDIKKCKDPMYLEDLAINGRDLIEAGIAEGEEVGKILNMLVDVVHRYPGMNTKPKLLKRAKKLKKNPLSAMFRNI
ncbi:MAG: hypothetical protein GX076_02310, partial [Clostridiales bacterium]|nr:hypothetical protein [Clostridiales bacterium]